MARRKRKGALGKLVDRTRRRVERGASRIARRGRRQLARGTSRIARASKRMAKRFAARIGKRVAKADVFGTRKRARAAARSAARKPKTRWIFAKKVTIPQRQMVPERVLGERWSEAFEEVERDVVEQMVKKTLG